MKPFLYQVAETFYREYGREIEQIAFVFPNRRAGAFFKKYLIRIIDTPLFSPTITTVSDLFARLSKRELADHIYLLFTLYRHYIDLSSDKESFDEFLPLGETLLNDFDDVDKYMVDARQLFTNIHDLKEIDSRFGSPLTEEQLSYIRRFWKSFVPIGESSNKSRFMALWKILFELYTSFRNDLSENGLAYEGMMFREVAERANVGPEIPYDKIVFVGLNVLNRAEETLMKALQKKGIADFYWDDAASTLKDNYNRASYFLRTNAQIFPSQLKLSGGEEEYPIPEVRVMGIPSAVGQTKQCGVVLQKLLQDKSLSSDPDRALNTAIVLPDEHLLMPMLYAIPQEIHSINITMGYPLSGTSVAGLMDILADLQKHIRRSDGTIQFYHRNVLSLLSNRYIQLSGQSEVNRLADAIRKYNKVFVSQSELAATDLLRHLFVPLERPVECCDYLLHLLLLLQEELNGLESADNPEEEPLESVSVTALEREFIYSYYLAINRLKGILEASDMEMTVTTFFKILKKITTGISVPFEGEPLSGLQIMGVLETRALDFENIIILSMNEGVFPVKKVASSLIPYNLRRGFELSTTEHQDSIYAYYFYRLISRAKRVFLLYDTRTENLSSGEVSRYIYQLKYHYRFDLKEEVSNYTVATKGKYEIAVRKDEYVMQQLARYLEGGDRSLSASAINTYITCPLQFYLGYVEGYRKSDEVAEDVDAAVLGSIYHGIMQQIYDRMEGRKIEADDLKAIEQDEALLTTCIEEAFAKNYFKTQKIRSLSGKNYLTGEVIRKYVKRTLEFDRSYAPFTYLKSERRITCLHPFDKNRKVSLKGFIDRTDMKDLRIRIVDYKTGYDNLEFNAVEELFDKRKMNKRPKAVMQVCLYAMMVAETDKPDLPIEPAIYRIQKLYSDKKWETCIKMKGVMMNNFREIEEPFRKAFDWCLHEIFNPDIPFFQVIDTGTWIHCSYCAFASICQQKTK